MEHSFASLTADLHRMGLTGEETIMIHSSMKKIGPVEGGAETVLEVLKEYFRKGNGLLVFPAFSYASILNAPGKNVFDVRNTPCCVGILPELFRSQSGVKRSLHPLHSLAAWGRECVSFTEGHEKYDTAFNLNGPFGRLPVRNGKILLAGVGLTACTYFHALEEWACVDILSRNPLSLYVQDETGNRFARSVYWHKGAHSEMFDRALKLLEAGGALHHVRFGSAASLLLDCRKSAEILLPLLREKKDFFFNPECPPQAE
ncbi:MAG: AAC(3) family N-acetyltransferase [Lentisphaeria bacterium]|nr:AAC(3) family N-acetyltransferase [Lentisphaeria bacterium]